MVTKHAINIGTQMNSFLIHQMLLCINIYVYILFFEMDVVTRFFYFVAV